MTALDLTEKDLQAQVVALARTLAFRVYHTFDSRKSAHGFPDLVLLRERAIFVELKRDKGRLTDHQRDWIRALKAANEEVYVVRPAQLQELATVLAARRRMVGTTMTFTTEGQVKARGCLLGVLDAELEGRKVA